MKNHNSEKGSMLLVSQDDKSTLTKEMVEAYNPNGYLYLLDPVAVTAHISPNFFNNPTWNTPPNPNEPKTETDKDGTKTFVVAQVMQEVPHLWGFNHQPTKIHAEVVGMIMKDNKGVFPMVRIITDKDINKETGDTNRYNELGRFLWRSGFEKAFHNVVKPK